MPSIDLKKIAIKRQTRSYGKQQEKTSDLNFLNREITFGNKEISDKKKESLYLELSSLLKAGINLKSALELIITDQQDKVLFLTIKNTVISGSSLSQALQQTGRFSVYEEFSIQIGEESGKLSEVLGDLALFYKNKIKQRRKITSALTYPIVVMVTSFGAVFFMLKVVVPMFGDIFRRFGGELPWITQKILDISMAMESSFLPFIVVCILTSSYLYYARKTPVYRKISSKAILRLPVIGELVKKIYLARFCNSMRLLINAKLPLLRAITLSKQMIGYYPVESSLQKIETDILKGKSLHQSMQQFDLYPPKMIQLLKVGEETNQLDYFFEKISDQYVEEIEYKTTTLSSLMEPMIIIFLGIIVGVILISMYLPLFEMSNSFK